MLNTILKTKEEEVASLQLPEQKDVPSYSFYDALLHPNNKIALIAEVKKASPSKGVIREDFDPVKIARSYEAAGADAISVLTDEQYFQGHRDYLSAIKEVVSIPVMRKDFIIDERQIEETVRIGADAVLLIVGTVPIDQLNYLYDVAYDKGLDCLVEVHAKEELEQLLETFTPKIIGVNNRDLKTFNTSLTQTEEMAKLIPKESIFISESGIFTSDDIDRVARAGASGVLVGESLMRAETPEIGIKTLFGGRS